MSGSRTPTSLMLRESSSSFAASKCLRGFVGDSPSFPSGINWNDVLLLWTELALDILLSPFFLVLNWEGTALTLKHNEKADEGAEVPWRGTARPNKKNPRA